MQRLRDVDDDRKKAGRTVLEYGIAALATLSPGKGMEWLRASYDSVGIAPTHNFVIGFQGRVKCLE
jgi:hypothetical protein